MSKSSQRLFLVCDGNVYNFLSCDLRDSDGSLYISFLRGGSNDHCLFYDSHAGKIQRVDFVKPKEKLKRISYHASGCVRYHNMNAHNNYFEPVSNISNLNYIASYIIPSANRLDRFVGNIADTDFLLEVPNCNNSFQFDFFIASCDFQINAPHVRLTYNGLFSLVLVINSPSVISICEEMKNYFTILTPMEGVYQQQAVDEHNALISFHQKKNAIQDLIIYSPNNEGIYKIICAVPMRIPPEVQISFVDNQYTAEVISKTESVIRFKAKNRYGHTIKYNLPIKSIVLNAEL